MQKFVQDLPHLKVGLRILSFNNYFVLYPIYFYACYQNAISCELALIPAKVLFTLLVESLQSEFQDFFFLQNLNMEMDNAVYALYPSLDFLQSILTDWQIVYFVFDQLILYLDYRLVFWACSQIVKLVFEIGLVLFEKSLACNIRC